MITYKVKARLAKGIGTDDFQIEEFEKDFENEKNPIEARKSAYNYYSSIADVIGDESNDFDAIKSHIDKLPAEFIELDSEKFRIPNPKNLGVGLYFVLKDEPESVKVDLGLDYKEGERHILIGYNSEFSYLSMAFHLEQELELYKLKEWKTESWEVEIKYWDYDAEPHEEEFKTSKVLFTPFDFWEYHNPSKIESVEKSEPQYEKSAIEQIIEAGESRKVEFKSTLRYCLKNKKPEFYVEHSITKTLAALANSKGGILLLGVSDSGEVLGIENDISSFRDKRKDKFLNHFDNLIKGHFSAPVDALLNYDFEIIDDKELFYVMVKESTRPIFINTKEKGKQFFIRRSASTHSLDVEEAINYAKDKWYA